MGYNFTVEDILNAKEVHLFDRATLYIVDSNDNAYGYCRGRKDWFLKQSFWDYFDSEMMMSYFECITKEEAARLYLSWEKEL